MFKRLVSLAAALLVQTACAVQPAPGQPIELHGKLALRGNEPFVYPVVHDRRGVWQLDGVAAERAAALQDREVTVRGTIVQFEPHGVRLPTVHVESLSAP